MATKKNKRKTSNAGRPRREATKSIRVSESSHVRILKTVRASKLSIRDATDMLLELGELAYKEACDDDPHAFDRVKNFLKE